MVRGIFHCLMISMFLWVVCHPVISFAQIKPLTKVGITRAVVVGVSDYQDDGIGDLQFAHRDAAAFEAYLRSPAGGALTDEHLFVLINEAATRAQFGRALEWLLSESQAGDQAIIYFSGHGDVSATFSEPGFLLLWDAIPQVRWDGGTMSLFDVKEKIITMSLQNDVKTILIIDACKSGKIKYSDPTLSGKQKEIQNKNEITLFSCQPSELSHEGLHWGDGRGVFSYYLVEGLYGKADINTDGVVNVNEIRNYVKTNVAAQIHPKQQTPEVVGIDEFPIAHVDNNPLASNKPQHSSTLETFYPASPRGFKEDRMMAKLDTNERNIYRAYQEALKTKRFFEPADDCADFYFEQLITNEHLAEWHNHLRYDYAAELQDDAQQIINKILKVNIAELNKSTVSRLISYKPQLRNISRAVELLGERHYYYNNLMSRYHLFTGIIYYLENRHLKTVENGEAVLQHYHKADSYYPNNPLTYFYISECYATQFKNQDSVVHYLTKAIERDPDWVLPYAYIGHYLSRYFEQPKIAREYLDQGIKVDPDNLFLLKSIGSWHYYQKQFNDAISYYKIVITRDSFDYTTWVNLAACYMNINNYKLAEHAYQQSIAIEPNQPKAFYHLGFLYYNDNRLTDAEITYQKGITLDPKDTKLKARLILVYLDQERFAEAEEACNYIHSVDPGNYRYWYYKACIAALQKKENEALDLIDKALQADQEAFGAIRTSKYLASIRANVKFKNLQKKYADNLK